MWCCTRTAARRSPPYRPKYAAAVNVARQAVMWSRVDLAMRPAMVNGAAGVVATRNGAVFAIASVIVRHGKIAEMDFLADPERLARIDLTILDARS